MDAHTRSAQINEWMNDPPHIKRKRQLCGHQTSDFPHVYCLVWPGAVPAEISFMHVPFCTFKLDAGPFLMYHGKIKATTSKQSGKIHCQCPSGLWNVNTMKVDAKLHTPPHYQMPLCFMFCLICQHHLLLSGSLIFIDHLIYPFLTSLAPSGAVCPSVEAVMTGLLLR